MARKKLDERVDLLAARDLLQTEWEVVGNSVGSDRAVSFIDDSDLREWIKTSVNHLQVGYRFCLPVQLLGKLTNAALDALSLQRGSSADADSRSWDARSLASKVIAPFNLSQESVLGSSNDPYVGNAMRIPRMERGDGSKRDPAGWNVLIDVLERVESRADVAFTRAVFRQVLLEFANRQASLSFTYPVPPRTGTLLKARQRGIREVLFAAARPVGANAEPVSARMDTAFAAGQNLYRFDTLDLARVVLALTGEGGRHRFLSHVGLHLDTWNTQPGHRTAWKKLLESV